MSTIAPSIAQLAEALTAARPELDQDDVGLAFAVYQRLAGGRPVTESTLAEDTGLAPDKVRDSLDSWPGVYRNEQGSIVGFWGLTIVEMPPHRYRVGESQLYAWCAWDTLFLTRILGAEARVESVDALTGELITLTITPNGVKEASHPSVVVSFLQPVGRFDADVVTSFCHYVHFFANRENGERWASEHALTFLLDIEEAFDLGARYVDSLRHGGVRPTQVRRLTDRAHS